VLIHFDLAKLIQFKTDASGYAIAGIISQQAREVREAKECLSDCTERAMKHAVERAAERAANGH
jgi:hypothetical protein